MARYGERTVRRLTVRKKVTLVDFRGRVSEDLLAKFRKICTKLKAPPVVVFVVHTSRYGGYSGRAYGTWLCNSYVYKGVRYKFSRPALVFTIRFADDVGPNFQDVYKGPIWSRDGTGTILFLFTHELLHVCGMSFRTGETERDVSRKARVIAKDLFPEHFVRDRCDNYDHWKAQLEETTTRRTPVKFAADEPDRLGRRIVVNIEIRQQGVYPQTVIKHQVQGMSQEDVNKIILEALR